MIDVQSRKGGYRSAAIGVDHVCVAQQFYQAAMKERGDGAVRDFRIVEGAE